MNEGRLSLSLFLETLPRGGQFGLELCYLMLGILNGLIVF